MMRFYFWQNVVLLGVLTLMIRASFFYLYSYITISNRVKSALGFIPMAVLPALAVPSAFFHEGDVVFLGGFERFFALILAFFVCLKTKNVFMTILSGLIFLYIIKAGA